MCLVSVDSPFNLTWDEEEQDFVGIGYKHYSNIKDEFGNINIYELNAKFGQSFSLFGWNEANGNFGSDLKVRPIQAENLSSYWPGFHIFLNEKDASDYGIRDTRNALLKVKYKNVICYGRNETFGPYREAVCVIAKSMKIVEDIKYVPKYNKNQLDL